MDKLDKFIADKQAEIDDLEKRIAEFSARRDKLVFQLETLKQAAELRPVETTADFGPIEASAEPVTFNGHSEPDQPKKTGRQTGDIAKEWRSVLRTIWQRGAPASYDDFHKTARAAGIKCEIANVRGRVRHFADVGFVSGDPERGFQVTENAARRFSFKKREALTEENPASASH